MPSADRLTFLHLVARRHVALDAGANAGMCTFWFSRIVFHMESANFESPVNGDFLFSTIPLVAQGRR